MTPREAHAKTGCGKGSQEVSGSPRTVPLAVVEGKLKGDRLHIRKSRMSRWRAGVLIAVNVLMVAHILQWKLSPSHATISPVEPSETMYTINDGKFNAGFVFFSVALLSTFVFGRFFCGWGCHVVALQDLCAHWMKKLGVKPRPFRSRILLLGPLLLALYMFAWVPFQRLVLFPLFKQISWYPPTWLLPDPQHAPELQSHLIVTEFWKTFPTWFVAIPFLIVCGFAVVYFLGSKGFCTYACPYGGFFAPVDKISVGRIVVNDNCEGCGHCTAVCTSNVRVHQEVRDYGMVVDPGCMKCLDCVSVCPNEALSFSFSRPAVAAKPRTTEAIAHKTRRPEYDLTLWQDLLLMGVTILLFMSFRGMFLTSVGGELGFVPLLMAAGMAAIGSFVAWKLWTLLREPNVRLQSLVLRNKGRFRLPGGVFAVGAAAYLGLACWAGVVQTMAYIGGVYDERVAPATAAVFFPGYKPEPTDRANALAAIRWMERAGPISEGGFGWPYTVEGLKRRAWLYSVAGDLASAERCQRQAIETARPTYAALFLDLGRIMSLRGSPDADVLAMLQKGLDENPSMHQVRLAIAGAHLQMGDVDRAVKEAEYVGAAEPIPEAFSLVMAGDIMLDAQRPDRALAVFKRGTESYAKYGLLHAEYARALWMSNQPAGALTQMKVATELEPKNPTFWRGLAEILAGMGRGDEAAAADAKARALVSAGGGR